jgi:DNA-directed RNA polymerase specialized sigma24 family protein
VFDLVAIEGFSPESASNILNISRDSVQKIVERTKAWLREYIQGRAKETSKTERKAS